MDDDVITDTLKARGQNYGAFKDHAKLSDMLNQVLEQSEAPLEPHHKEALRIIFNKIGRILNGNPNYIDSWRDICGYSQLVVDILQDTLEASDSKVIPVIRTKNGWEEK